MSHNPPAPDRSAALAPPSAPIPGDATPRPQAMLFTLWGDYVVHRGGEIWTGSLIRVAAEFGISELALRSVLSRMVRSGWLEAAKRGNRSYYRLTKRGRKIIEEGTARIFHRDRPAWDGAWRLVVYSVPETERELRDQFRKRLLYLGFGPLAPGTWISPHDLQPHVGQLAAELGMHEYVDQFRAAHLPPGDARNLAARVWPLDRLAEAYCAFLDRWTPVAAELDPDLPDPRAFVLRFWLLHEFQRFFLDDPGLPPDLVPPDWPGHQAADLFETLHDHLAPGAMRFFDAVFQTRPHPSTSRATA